MTPEIEQLIHDVLHGQASDEDRQRLSDWITSSEGNARAYLRVAMDERGIKAHLERASARSLDALDESPDDSGAGMLLAELARAEAAVDAPLVELIDLRTSWVREHAKPLLAAAGVMLAAVIVLAVLLIVQDPESTRHAQQVALDDSSPSTDMWTQGAESGVATLTAERGAVWQGVAGETLPGVGDALVAGQRLRLAEGIAQITTRRGAIAIVQAPARLQMLGDNQLRLHAGKLLGICETPSSKGFVVRTSSMDITDLGTRFGIDATGPEVTSIHVLEGMVQVARPSLTGEAATTQTLTQGQGAIAYAGRDDLEAVAAEPQRFAALNPRTIQLLGTGQGLAVGEVDPNWQVIAINGQPLTPAGEMTVSPAAGGPRDLEPNDPASSQWLRVPEQLDPDLPRRDGHTYTVRTRFDWPKDIDPDTASLRLRFDADDRIGQVRINGKSFALPQHSFTDEDPRLNEATLAGAFVAGTNTIEFDVIDIVRGKAFVWAMRVAWQIEAGTGSQPDASRK